MTLFSSFGSSSSSGGKKHARRISSSKHSSSGSSKHDSSSPEANLSRLFPMNADEAEDDVTPGRSMVSASTGKSSRQSAGDDHSTISGLSLEDGSYELFMAARQRRSTLRRSSEERMNELTVSQLRFSSIGLYGRENETRTLREACERAELGDSRQLLLISGCAGTGKSTLALQVNDMMQQVAGFHINGKFDLQEMEEPYSGIASACRQLCGSLLEYRDKYCDSTRTRMGSFTTHSSSATTNPSRRWMFTYDEIQSKLQEELGADVGLLSRVVPNLLHIVCGDGAYAMEEMDDASVGHLENRNRFNFAFRRFMRVVGSFGPLAITLDDLQWADRPSLDLIETLITDQENPSLMIVGCCRSEEMDESCDLAQLMGRIEEQSEDNGVVVCRIEVGNLDVTQITDMLVDLLAVEADQIEILAEAVHRKTLGNAFFVVQLLMSLAQAGLLKWNLGTTKWYWDIDQIMLQTSASQNVVEFMQQKLEKLPLWMQRMLPMIACLGSSFQSNIFSVVVERLDVVLGEDGDEDVLRTCQRQQGSFLECCIEEGLIEHVGVNSYHWVHDKIEEAALSLISGNRLMTLKFRLGQLLLDKLTAEELEDVIFVVANLLNEGVGTLATDDPWRHRIAEINLQAGVKAVASSAFQPAIKYLTKGIDFLPEDHWRTSYELSLEMFSAAAEAEYCVGDFESMQTHCDAVLAQTERPLLDKRRAYNVLLDSTGAQDRMQEAIDMCLQVLSQLGCRFPRRAIRFFVKAGIARTKLTLKSRTPEQISALGTMTDPSKLWAMTLLNKLVTYLYFEKSPLLPLAILKGLRWTIRYGVSDVSSHIFTLVGLMLVAQLGDFSGGKVYANHALALLKQASSRKDDARVLYVTHVFVLHWTTPLHDCKNTCLSVYRVGMATGDMESAMWGLFFCQDLAWHTGSPLPPIARDFALCCDQMKEFKQRKPLASARLTFQVILNLIGKSEHTFKLKGKVADEDEIEKILETKEIAHLRVTLRRLQIYLAFFFCEFERVLDLLNERDGIDYFMRNLPGTPGLCPLVFQCALANISMARSTVGRSKRRAYRRQAMKLTRKIKRWVELGNPNVLHYESLLDAEHAALGGYKHTARKHYCTAILLAGRAGILHEHALAHERFGQFYLADGERNEAEYHLSKAVKLYEEWGGFAKSDMIKEKYARLLSPPPPPPEIVLNAAPA